MTNNLNTIEGAQQEVIDQLEYNLQAKGVLDAQFNPTTGLLGLINRIPDIEPSTNINLNITLTLTSAEPSVGYGGSILLSATLMASYEGASDVDLKTGEITGATITFKKGGTIIGTSITDNNGVATLLYTPVAADCDTTLNLSAVFSGTDNFNSANSNNINVDVNSTLELTSDKDILSYADNEYATLTATLNSADKNNKEIIFEVRKQSDDSLVETLTGNTDSSGNATVYYYGKASGDLYIQGFSNERILHSEIYEIEDCDFYTDGSIVPLSVTIQNGASFTSNGDYLTITTATSGQKNVYYPTILTNSDDWLFEVELAHLGAIQHITTSNDNGSYFLVNAEGSGLVVWKFNDESGNHTQSKNVSVGDKFRWEYKNGTLYYYHNGTLIANKAQTFSNPLKFISYTNKDGNTSRVQHLKNIKIKRL